MSPHTAEGGSLLNRIVILFDVDGTLISTGGAGARSSRWAFETLHGVSADICQCSEAGMTDPVRSADQAVAAVQHRGGTSAADEIG